MHKLLCKNVAENSTHRRVRAHTYLIHPIRPCMGLHARARGSCKNADPGAGLGVMLVEEGGADGEAGGDSPSSSAKLKLVSVLGRDKCSGAAAAAGWEGRSGGTRGLLRRIGLLRLNPGQPTVWEVGVGLSRR